MLMSVFMLKKSFYVKKLRPPLINCSMLNWDSVFILTRKDEVRVISNFIRT